MKLLTTSKNLIESLNKIDIFTSEDVFNHLPFRYEDMSYTDDTFLEDNQKVTILGKLVSNPKLARIPKFDIITFYFVSFSAFSVCSVAAAGSCASFSGFPDSGASASLVVMFSA